MTDKTTVESKGPLLKLKDGDVISFEDNHFGGGGGCDTCGYGGECDTDLTITFSIDGRKHVEEIDGVNGSYALTFVMRKLAEFPSMTIEEFIAGLRAFCEEAK